jgi:hypothetical protein
MNNERRKLNVDGGEFLKHLTFWHNKTDDECIALASNEHGTVDAEQALTNMLERDFCTEINNTAVEMLKELGDKNETNL